MIPFSVFTFSTRVLMASQNDFEDGVKAGGVSVFLLNSLSRASPIPSFQPQTWSRLCLSTLNPFLPVFCNPLITVTL